MAKKPKFTRAQIKRQVENIQDAIEKLKREGPDRGEDQFRWLTAEEIENKLKRVNSPFLGGQAYTGWTSPGGSISYTLTIVNPDPTPVDYLFAQVWVGWGNFDPTIGTFLLSADTRFPRAMQPASFSGLQMPAGPATVAALSFDLSVPTGIEPMHYMAQTCLFRAGWLDVGQYLDRAMFVFAVG